MKFKFFGSLIGFAWSMVSGIAIAFIGLLDGPLEFKAKPWWFIGFAVLMTAITTYTLMASMADTARELDQKGMKRDRR